MLKLFFSLYVIFVITEILYSQTGYEESRFYNQVKQNKVHSIPYSQRTRENSDSIYSIESEYNNFYGTNDSLIFNSKQIKVSATLFELDIEKMKERGINWQAIISKPGLELNSAYKSLPKNTTNTFDYSLNLRLEGDIGRFSGFNDALFKFLEDENLGKLESKLSVLVRNGKPARMQVGSDFSIKQKDFAGNVMDAFYPTGTIIEVVPKILNFDTIKCALLNVNIERSYAVPGLISTEVKKTNASSEVILRDGEEITVGGLLYNQYEIKRNGIPFFKDLPWWVLGLRYLTGYERLASTQKDIVVLIKIEIIPSLAEKFPSH